jgi:hypothetical protein
MAQLTQDSPLPLVVLVNADDALALVATANPPRLFLEPDRRGADGPPERRALSDQAAGHLVAGNAAWICPNVVAAVTYLIDSWCERRCLGPLGLILRAWPTNGLTDGAHELLAALRRTQIPARDQATDFERELLLAAESALAQRLSSG